MPDLQNPRLIYLKGALFLLCGVLSAATLLAESLHWRTAALLVLTAWSFCRFYYFAFYVIQHYVDDEFRFAGLWDFAKHCRRSRAAPGLPVPAGGKPPVSRPAAKDRLSTTSADEMAGDLRSHQLPRCARTESSTR